MRLLVCASLLFVCAGGQRYAERNVPPADTFPSPADPTSYDYDYENYGFDEEEPNVHKWNVETFPHPVQSPTSCRRPKSSHVCDPDLVLEREEADSLDRSIQELYRDTPCICGDACSEGDGGIVVGIALLKHMYHPYNVHPAKVIRSFAETLRFRWRLGRCDNDLLIVVATTDRLSYTDVGDSTSEYLTIGEAHRIFLDNKSKFSASNFSEGLANILEGYRRTTRAMATKLESRKKDTTVPVVAGAVAGSVLLIGLLLLVGCLLIRRRRRTRKEAVKEVSVPDRGSTVSSSWSKKDIQVVFASDKTKSPPISSAKYQKCETEENDDTRDDEEVLDFTLATPNDSSFPNETRVASDSAEALDQDLAIAAEGIARTFPPKNGNSVLVTDM